MAMTRRISVALFSISGRMAGAFSHNTANNSHDVAAKSRGSMGNIRERQGVAHQALPGPSIQPGIEARLMPRDMISPQPRALMILRDAPSHGLV
jgi:hypothetical protein